MLVGWSWIKFGKLLSSLSGWPRTVAQGMWHVILGFDDDDDEEEEEDEDN